MYTYVVFRAVKQFTVICQLVELQFIKRNKIDINFGTN